jgi:hypothetical protein
MKIKTKRMGKDGIVREEAHGSIKEIMAHADIMNLEKETIQICFRGQNVSGIIELSPHEAENLSKSFAPLVKLKKNIKVLKLRE